MDPVVKPFASQKTINTGELFHLLAYLKLKYSSQLITQIIISIEHFNFQLKFYDKPIIQMII